jgi:hypothetical protein
MRGALDVLMDLARKQVRLRGLVADSFETPRALIFGSFAASSLVCGRKTFRLSLSLLTSLHTCWAVPSGEKTPPA